MCFIQLRKKEIVALVMVRVSSQYFAVWIVYRTDCKKDFVALARVRASSQYFLVWGCIPYSYARMMAWLSLGLGLAVSISQFWIVYHTVAQE